MSTPLTPTAPETDEALAPGSYVGPYIVDEAIGAGMFGTVYAAHHPVIDKTVAIKVLHRRYSSDPEMVARFVDEARAASHIDHSGIVAIFDFGRLADGRRYTVMERLSGQGLDALLDARGALEPAEALDILEPLAHALEAAHAAGVAHRDVKPANVFVCADGQPKLLDFGVAKLLGMPSDAERTATGVAVGTPAYMAPEQCLGSNVGPAVDVYALGVMAFRMLTGRLPFEIESSVLMMAAHLNDPPPWLHRVDPRFGKAAARVLRRMMEKDPARRPAPVAAIDALRRGLGEGRAASWPVVGAAAVIVGAVALALWAVELDTNPLGARSAATDAATDVTGHAAIDARPSDMAIDPARDAESAPLDAAAPGPADTGPPFVDITLAGLPPGATATADGAPVALVNGALRLPRGSKPVTLVIDAPGHEAHTREVVPAASHAVEVALTPHAPRPKPPRKPDPHGIDDW